MTKHILTIILFAMTMLFCPTLSNSTFARIELSEIENSSIKIELANNKNILYVYGAAGKTIQFYNLVGVIVMSVKIDSSEKAIDISKLKNVIHIVRVGNISKKINLLSR